MKNLKYHNLNPEFVSTELRNGKIFIIPTDTCYGIMGKVSKDVVEKIYKIKNRPKEKSIPIFIRKDWVDDFMEIGNSGSKIIDKFWPGALSIVGKAKEDKFGFLKPVLGPGNTVSLREPNYDMVLRILNHFTEPVTSTSANISGESSCYSKKDVLKQFEGREHQPDYVLDVHSLPKRKSSTIIDIETLEILRVGEIPKNAIVDFINS